MRRWVTIVSAALAASGVASLIVARKIEALRDRAESPEVTAEDSAALRLGSAVSVPRLSVKNAGLLEFEELLLPPAFDRALRDFGQEKGGEAYQFQPESFESPQQVHLREASSAKLVTLDGNPPSDWQPVAATSGSLVLDLNADGRADAVTVVWIREKRLISVVALMTGKSGVEAQELFSGPAPADSIERVEIRELEWTTVVTRPVPRVSYRLSPSQNGRGVRWLPARCDGPGKEWSWKYGRFWESSTECTAEEAAGPPDQQLKLTAAVILLKRVGVMQATDLEVLPLLNSAEQMLVRARSHDRRRDGSDPLSRMIERRLLGTRALKTAAFLAHAHIDSALSSAARWRRSAMELRDVGEENEAVASIAAIYALLDRPEVFDEYLPMLQRARLSRRSSTYLSISAEILSGTLSNRGEAEWSRRVGAAAVSIQKQTDSSRRSVVDAGFAAVDSNDLRLLVNATEQIEIAARRGSPEAALGASQEIERIASLDPLMRARLIGALGAIYSSKVLGTLKSPQRRGDADRYLNVGIKYLRSALHDAEEPLTISFKYQPIGWSGQQSISNDADRIGYSESWIPLQSLLSLDLLLAGEPGEALLASQRLSDIAADPYALNEKFVTPFLDQFRSNVRGSVLIFLPMVSGFGVVASHYDDDEWTSPALRYFIPDSNGRLLRLAAANRILVEREAGIRKETSGAANADDRAVYQLADSLTRMGGSRQALRELSDALLPDSVRNRLGKGGNLVIYAPGALGLVPFAALPVRGATGTRTPLLESYTVRMTTGPVDAFKQRWADNPINDFRRRGGRPEALVLGNPTQSQPSFLERLLGKSSKGPAPLPSAAAEANEVARLLGVTSRTGELATKREVLDGWASRGIIHIAAHTHIDTHRGGSASSYIQLSPDSTGDGRLSIADLRRDNGDFANGPDLVVLSGCDSGLGETKWVSGIMGFQRAVIQAGARSVITTLWPVLDESSKLLMTAFYRHWLQDKDMPNKPEALRRAQNEIRRLPGYESPYYWAGFQLAGAP